MTEEELKHCEQLATALRMVEGFDLADAVDELIAEVRRLQVEAEQGRCPHDSLTARAHHETGWHPVS